MNDAAGLGRHPGLQRGRGHRPVPGRILREVRCRARSWSSHDMPEDTTVPVVEGERGAATRACARCSTPTGAGRPTRSASASTRRQRPVVVVTMADGSDDPRQIDDLARLVERGVVVAAASGTCRRPAGRRAAGSSGCCRAGPAGRCTCFARVGTRDATNSFKAYRPEFVREVGIESRDGLRDRPRADRQGAPAAAAGRGDPHDLARSRRRGRPTSSCRQWLPQYLRWYWFAFGRRASTLERNAVEAAAPARQGRTHA